jgi:tryptophan synthase alpha chain
MSYANPLQRRGWPDLAARAAAAGADALIVPDLPVEEAAQMREAAAAHGLGTVFFIAPTSSAARRVAACAASTAFVYVLGRVGVTGATTRFDAATLSFLDGVRAQSTAPVAVGFGISTPEEARAAGAHADLVIVGTALVQRLHEERSAGRDAAAAAHAFVHSLVTSLPPAIR